MPSLFSELGLNTLRANFVVCRVRSILGPSEKALAEARRFWELLQDSKIYHLPEVQGLVRLTARELASLGDSSYLEAIEESQNG